MKFERDKKMIWLQKQIKLKPRGRGFHLVTNEIVKDVPELTEIEKGIANIFIQHTSASLAINENADPTVRDDMESYFNRLVPENQSYFKHNYEGADDMPAHLKSVLLGSSLNIPITNGELNLGTWQGVYLCEHRNNGGSRKIVITVFGE